MEAKYITSFGNAFCNSINAIGFNFNLADNFRELPDILIEDEILGEISFCGSVTGRYYAGMSSSAARYLLDNMFEIYETDLLYSTLSELLNIAVGEAFSSISEDFDNLTYFSPYISHGPIKSPSIQKTGVSLVTDEGVEINLYFMLDMMSLDIQRKLDSITTEKDKNDKLMLELKRLNTKLIDDKEKINFLFKKSQEAAKVKSEFLAVMSHEMRTPLNAVIGYTDILLDEPLSLEQREMLLTVRRSGDGLLAIINDVLDLSKIEAHQMEIEQVAFNLEDVVFDSAEMGRAKITNECVEVNVDIGNTFAHVIGDPTKLRQVITNLMSNAVKFTEKGEVILTVEPILEKDGWQSLKFSVKDTGIGMSKEQCALVFEPFRQADSSTSRKYGGTGLGLAICKGLVEGMGGKLNLFSEPGKGSCFSFELKFKIPKNKTTCKVRKQDFKGKRSCIIDDCRNATRVLKHYLERYGMQVETFSGYENYENSRSVDKYDIAYIDLMQPGVDGFSILKKLKESKAADKIVAISALMNPSTTSRINNSGFDSFFCKPIRPSSLYSLTTKILNRNHEEKVYVGNTAFDGMTLNILVAEDNAINQRLIQKVLTKMGHKIDIAENGKVAVEKVKNHVYDFIFMDMQMPEMGGVEAAKQIRALPGGLEIPIVAMTANAMEHFKEECLLAGMNDFIAKPFKRERIWQVLNEYCNDRDLPELEDQPRLLIVEDDQTLRILMENVLSNSIPNVSWKFADDGLEACALLGSFQPHLIITDLIMPKMDGLEFIRFLKDKSCYSDIGIFVNSSLVRDDERVMETISLGVEEIFTKPFKRDPMIRSIKRYLFRKLVKFTP